MYNRRVFGSLSEVAKNQTSGWNTQQVSIMAETTALVIEGRLSTGNVSVVALQSVEMNIGICGVTTMAKIVY